ncbi:MAG: NERD domain-containing protein [Chloroflexi bacterium]|nr:NERD domain-containing protein [Chloroflexota bacterium]
MRIIDKTPFQNEKGEIDLIGRAQATLKYGPSWYPEQSAQKAVIAQLDRLFEKGYVLIRNFNLPGSEVIVPMILLTPSGVFVIYVTHLKGFYEAKGDQWNKIDQGRAAPAQRNLISITERLARATQKYFEIQQIAIPGRVEPVLMAAEPGLNMESLRPIIRVVKSDAIAQFASTVLQTRSILRNEQVYDLAERITLPRVDETAVAAAPQPAQQKPASRARAIFDASPSPKNTGSQEDISFAFDEDEGASESLPPGLLRSTANDSDSLPARRKLYMGMTVGQWIILGVMLLVGLCVLSIAVAAIYYYYYILNPI